MVSQGMQQWGGGGCVPSANAVLYMRSPQTVSSGKWIIL